MRRECRYFYEWFGNLCPEYTEASGEEWPQNFRVMLYVGAISNHELIFVMPSIKGSRK
ncbi:hypothetical protein APHCR_0303 [Anaplasma phagocytophilum str. CR1007]|uniref:Uncharacterized protein n=1 Tax=Anaplasma phagocytophilum str. NCH-1 TaxID=1359161 RepID=A0A0F3N5I5_ANAPH|nr:hypothetical protein APHWEB_1218 [Anaplasma phagocytophilum str. Webster]KJV63001.1 hypothetical protein EPHNCH_1118 [Anaplasma phagocytophilum str. NCH-1]KJV82785.1 hypothetical protein APHHGE2_1095 [Anaplasma phagocytophilum str. HGE2]KJV87317.1 hypothetical protein APHNYW_0809 [Anaplasma phagocytophilum str. ApNYW]KJV98607.1 hypothetical protein OTSANNIE_1069 [Anaplasma phagocytophilum str. Annie]KJZ98467.1 hypothetical protein APHCR_0303 [Anaplasma phagocytophilum str. CR1007]